MGSLPGFTLLFLLGVKAIIVDHTLARTCLNPGESAKRKPSALLILDLVDDEKQQIDVPGIVLCSQSI